MVIYSDTLIPCHQLTKEGKAKYECLLEKIADQILEDKKHPIKAFFRKMFENDSNSPWLS